MSLLISLLSVLLLLMVFKLFLDKTRGLEKINTGVMHVLEKSEENRLASEELINKIMLMIDDLPEGIIIINKKNEISIINSRAEKFLGVDRRQLLNKSILELGNVSGVKKIVFPVLFNFKGAHKEEIEVRKNFILELLIEPLVPGKNNTAKLIILHDITKTKMAQAEKNKFVSIVAHQLKSPLASTRLSLKVLLNDEFGKLSRQQKDILEKTRINNESLIYLVEDLLKEAQADGIGRSDNRAPINLEELVLPIADFYREETKRKKISLKLIKSNKKLPEVLADPEKIKMVVQNLIDNAIKYTPVNGKIEINMVAGKGDVEFSVRDSGIGIPDDQKDKIFSRFSRATNVFKAKVSGSGLGLAIAKDIIEKSHGKIWFESTENEGSAFFFSLPIVGN